MKKYIIKLDINTINLYYKRFYESLLSLNDENKDYISSRHDSWEEFEIYKDKIYCIVCDLTENEYEELSKSFNICDYKQTNDTTNEIYSLNEIFNFDNMTEFISEDGDLYRIDEYGELQRYYSANSSCSGYWDYPRMNKSIIENTFTLINEDNK